MEAKTGALTPAGQVSGPKRFLEEHPGEIMAHFFGRDILTAILNQEGCRGIRFYHGSEGGGAAANSGGGRQQRKRPTERKPHCN